MLDGHTIPDGQSIQIFLERLFGHFAVNTIHIALDYIEGFGTPFQTVGHETGALLSVTTVHDGRLQVFHGFTLYNEAASTDLLTTQANPDITDRKHFHRPLKKRYKITLTVINVA
jgi:hypothetical protein